MSDLRVKKARPMGHHEIRVPGDQSISHRVVILASLSNGPCLIRGFRPSANCLATVNAMRALGIQIDFLDEDGEPDESIVRPTRLLVYGRKGYLEAPADPIDCGSSATTMRLLAGLLSAQTFDSVLQGDASLSHRPMERVIEPLSRMGATIEALGGKGRAPLVIRGKTPVPFRFEQPIACSQTKGAILLAGLFAQGKTTVVEPMTTRDHTERILGFFQAKTLRERRHISVYGGQTLESRDFFVPGDLSSAALWIVPAAALTDCQLTLVDVGLNPTRSGILKVLVNMGARIQEADHGDKHGEPVGDITIAGRGLRGVRIGGEIVANIIDELPIITVAGALAEGRTIIRNAHELRLQQSDRITAMVKNLNRLGLDVVEHEDGLEVEGRRNLKAASLDGFDDHRISTACAIAGLFAEGETTVTNASVVDDFYPDFADHLRAFGGFK